MKRIYQPSLIWSLLILFIMALALIGCGRNEGRNGATLGGNQPAMPAGAHADEEHNRDEHADGAHEEDGHADDEHADDEHDHDDHDHDAELEMLTLPALSAADLASGKLRVVATTSIIGDVVANVGGDAIDLTVLMGPGQDPHSYQPGAAQLTAVARAHVIFVNGWNLEEGLLDDLQTIGANVPIVPISANIAPLAFGAGAHEDEHAAEGDHAAAEEHDHDGADPHAWFSIHSVAQWTDNVNDVLSTLDPANAASYAANAAQYRRALAELEAYAAAQLATIPAEKRVLVTNHGSFGFFARDYDFEMLGTVIPSMSTLAEPSAADLADLITKMRLEGVCTLFTETTVSDKLASTVAAELRDCQDVQVIRLYTGAVGAAGSGADSYIGMFRANVDAIVSGLVR